MEHVWSLSFEPKAEGRHFVNITARTIVPGQPNLARGYAIPVLIGEAERVSSAKTTVTGENAVVFQAEETIITEEN